MHHLKAQTQKVVLEAWFNDGSHQFDFLKPINVQFLTVDIQKPGLQKLCLVATWAAKSWKANTSFCLCLCCCEKTFSEASGQYRGYHSAKQ